MIKLELSSYLIKSKLCGMRVRRDILVKAWGRGGQRKNGKNSLVIDKNEKWCIAAKKYINEVEEG